MAQIKVEALDKSFGAFHAVKAASFTVEDGQFLCLLGPSGCGKTSTLRMVAGHEAVSEGDIILGPQNVTGLEPAKRGTAMRLPASLRTLWPPMKRATNSVRG